jgi:hypothetical protein
MLRCTTDGLACNLKHAKKVSLRVEPVMGCDQIKNISALTGCPIGPKPCLLPLKHNLKAIARTAKHIAHKKTTASLLSRRKHHSKHRFEPSD